jgi:hypothetical protein
VAQPGNAAAVATRDARSAADPVAGRRREVDFAVVVGVEHYRFIRPLQGAVSDAKSFHAWLCDKSHGGLDRDNVRLILSQDSEDASRADEPRDPPIQQQIDAALDSVLKAACALGGARRLYFYFAGHGAGTGRSDDDVALLLTRCSASVRYALSTNRYSSALSGAGLFEEVAFFLDCCRSISFPVVGLPPMLTESCDLLISTRGFRAYATEGRRLAYEVLDPDRWQGIFTHCLVSILERKSSARFPARDLKLHLEYEVPKLARRRYDIDQSPEVHDGLKAESCFGRPGKRSLIDRLPFLRRLPVVGRWLAPAHWMPLELTFVKRQGAVELRDGKLRVVARHKAGKKPWRLWLPVGLYSLEGGGRPRFSFWHNEPEVLHDV